MQGITPADITAVNRSTVINIVFCYAKYDILVYVCTGSVSDIPRRWPFERLRSRIRSYTFICIYIRSLARQLVKRREKVDEER